MRTFQLAACGAALIVGAGFLCEPHAAAAHQDAGSDGASVFERSCAGCHDGAADSRAPALDALRGRPAETVIESLLTGAMRLQGSRLSGIERRAVAEYVSGDAVARAARPGAGRCTASGALSGDDVPLWSGWSPAVTNTRMQPADRAGLSPADVRRLRLKWAFGFPDANTAWGQPTLAGGRLFVGSQNGSVYALDARTGCTYWTFTARGSVRTAAVLGRTGPARTAVYVGTLNGYIHAIDAANGQAIWERQVESHPYGRLTGSPTFHRGRLYVPISSLEEAQGSIPDYPCCTFRGSLTALDASTGAEIWRTYTVPEPKPRGVSSVGARLSGPAGNAIWSAPTIDEKRGVVYAATGNTYSEPATELSDAVIAFDLQSGKIVWSRQMTEDVFVSRCPPSGNPNCPTALGPDFDFGNSPMLARLPGSMRELIVIGQKSGIGWALDPDRRGEIVWQYRAGLGGTLGGLEWGSAVDEENAYFPVSDIQQANPGGLHAVRLATGERVWYAPPSPPVCGSGRGCNAAQSAAITAIPGIVFSGSNDGALRAYSTRDGSIVWEFDTNRGFETVNQVQARGASMIGPGPVVGGGMVYVNSGYGQYGGRPGNVLLAFGVE